MKEKPLRMNKKIRKVIDYLFYALFGIVTLAVTWVGICLIRGEKPNILGYRLYAIQTDSMEPTLPVGSIILCYETADFTKLDTGTIITFKFNDKTNIPNTHRIVGFQYIDLETGEEKYTTLYQTQQDFYTTFSYTKYEIIGYKTQGDNPSLKMDPNPVYFADIESRFIAHIAIADTFYSFLMKPIGFIIMIAIPSFGIITVQIFSSLRKKKDKKIDEELDLEMKKQEERIDRLKEEAIKEYLAKEQNDKKE